MEKIKLNRRRNKRFFDPSKSNIKENVQDVEELYLLLIEKKLFGRMQLIDRNNKSHLNLISISRNRTKFALTFIRKVTYTICEQNITIHTANLLYNAIIKEIIKNESGEMKVLYDDTDSAPMYISCTGYKSQEEAIIEQDLIIKDKERTKKYEEALTVIEYIRKSEAVS